VKSEKLKMTDDLKLDFALSFAFHLILLLLLPHLKFAPPMRFVEVSLVAETSVLPKNFKRAYRKKQEPKKSFKVWSPGEGEPLPQAKISPEKSFSFFAPSVENDLKPEISKVFKEPEIPLPEPEKYTPSFKESQDKESFQISGPVSARKILRKVYPEYPQQAKFGGISGEVSIKFWVSSEGIIEKAEIEKTSGSDILDKAALDAIKRWLFAPLEGEKITQWGILNIRFELK